MRMLRSETRTPLSFHPNNIELVLGFHVLKCSVDVIEFRRTKQARALFVLFRGPITPIRVSILIFILIPSRLTIKYVNLLFH